VRPRDVVNTDIARLLREAREARALLLADVAKRTRTEPASVEAFESGTHLPSTAWLARFAAALRLDPLALLGGNHLVNRGFIDRNLRTELIKVIRGTEHGSPTQDEASEPSRETALERRIREAPGSGVCEPHEARAWLGLGPWDDLPGVPR